MDAKIDEEWMERLRQLPDGPVRDRMRTQLVDYIAERKRTDWEPYPWQVCPGEVPAMGAWALMGGRGTGKTDAGSQYVLRHVAGPPCDTRLPGGHRLGIVAPTLGDAVESAVNGPSGIRGYDPRVRLSSSAGGTHVLFHGGATAKLFGANSPDAVERLRSGGNRCLYWIEEAAAMRYLDEVLAHSAMGLRMGDNPHYVVTTTPKPRKAIIDLAESPTTLVTRGRTLEAYHLPPAMRKALVEKYGGTHLGRQELDGEILTEVRGALITRAQMDASRVPKAPDLDLTVVAVDPNGTETGDEFGIVVMGRGGTDRHVYVLADHTTHLTGRDAALRAWNVWGEYDADVLVLEENYGKAWLRQVMIDTWREYSRTQTAPPVKLVNAIKGKALRAEPTALRWEQGRVHLVDCMDELETQWATWVPVESKGSPDRVDAMVHGEAYLRGKERGTTALAVPVGRLR